MFIQLEKIYDVYNLLNKTNVIIQFGIFSEEKILVLAFWTWNYIYFTDIHAIDHLAINLVGISLSSKKHGSCLNLRYSSSC